MLYAICSINCDEQLFFSLESFNKPQSQQFNNVLILNSRYTSCIKLSGVTFGNLLVNLFVLSFVQSIYQTYSDNEAKSFVIRKSNQSRHHKKYDSEKEFFNYEGVTEIKMKGGIEVMLCIDTKCTIVYHFLFMSILYQIYYTFIYEISSHDSLLKMRSTSELTRVINKKPIVITVQRSSL